MVGIKALLIGMGVLLAAGFVILVVTLLGRMSSADDDGPAQAAVRLGAGERLSAARLDGGRVLFQIETPDGARVEVRNLADGGLIAKFELAPALN